MVRINWTVQSRNDLKDIAEFIAKDSKRYAKLQLVKIRRRTQLLKSHPLAGKKVGEYEMDTIRELIEGRYRIIYKIVTQDRVDILTVHHSSRDLSKRNIQ